MAKKFSNYEDLITFTRASTGHALRPVSYGTELVTNGTFDSDLSGWTVVSGSATVTNGEAVVSYDGANGGLSQYVTVEVGKLYEIKASLTATTSSGPRLKIGTTNNGNDIKNITTVADVFEKFVATTTTISIFAQAIGDGSTTIDNVSVKEVTFDQPNGTLTLFEHPTNIPRVEYDADRNRLGLLVEEQRINEINYSQDFDNADWTKTRCTITANQALAPDGTQTADLMTATDNDARLQDNISNSTDFVTQSVWVKSATGGDVAGQLDFAGLDTQAFTANGEWQRIHTTSTNLSFSDLIRIRITNSGDSLYVWGAQLEKGSFPTSYIKTTGSTATRSADVASIPVADFGYNQGVGALLVEAKRFGTSSEFPRIAQLTDGTSSERISVSIYGSGNTAYANVVAGGVSQASLNETTSTGADTYAKLGFSFADNDFAFVVDGVVEGTDTSGTVPDNISEMLIGDRVSADQQLNGHIKSIKYYPRRLTNAQLQELTT